MVQFRAGDDSEGTSPDVVSARRVPSPPPLARTNPSLRSLRPRLGASLDRIAPAPSTHGMHVGHVAGPELDAGLH